MLLSEFILRINRQSWLILVLLAALGLNLGQPKTIMAQQLKEIIASIRQQKSNFNPPQRGAPGNRNDAGSRSHDLAFLPLIPKNNKGLTISSHPTFWLYISPNFSCDKLGFSLVEKEGKTDTIFYKTQLKLSQDKGLIEFPLPPDAPPLTIGESYRWIFSCGANARYGEIERISFSHSFAHQINHLNQQEKLEILKERDVWYEFLTILVNLRRNFPENQNLKKIWDNLFKNPAVDLEEVIPLIP